MCFTLVCFVSAQLPSVYFLMILVARGVDVLGGCENLLVKEATVT